MAPIRALQVAWRGWKLNFWRETDDLCDVTINEVLIQDVFLRTKPGDLERVLTAIEAYRICVATLQKLRRTPHLGDQREQVMECAASCERALVEYAATGRWKALQYPPPGRRTDFAKAHLVLAIEW